MDSSGSDAEEEQRMYLSRPGHFTPTSSTNISRASRSVPSLYEAVEATHNKNESQQQQQLALTTEELVLPPNASYDPHNRRNTSTATSGKTKKLKHGKMPAAKGNFVVVDTRSSFRQAGASGYGVDPNHPGSNSTVGGSSSTPIRARPTVTTILRQQHVLERVERNEKDKVDSLMVSNSVIWDMDNVSRELEKKQQEEAKAAEAKRLLQVKLAYEKAIAASRKVADDKQRIAEDTRLKEKQWQSKLTQEREAEKQRRKEMTEQLQRATEDSKKAMEEMLRAKHYKAAKVKEETEQLRAEAQRKKHEEDRQRQDRIMQIQAAKIALKRTKETLGNPNQFYRSIAIPETQIKLRLQKEEEERRLQEQRRKIQAAKQLKSVKLIKAMKKIQSFENVAQAQKSRSGLKPPISLSAADSIPCRANTSNNCNYHSAKSNVTFIVNDNVSKTSNSIWARSRSTTANNNTNTTSKADRKSNTTFKQGELDDMLEELKKLRTQNSRMRTNEQCKRSQVLGGGGGSSIKYIGSRSATPLSNNDNQNQTNFYRNSFGILTVGKH